MLYTAIYSNHLGAGLRTVTFEAADLTEALKIVCTTQVAPEGAVEIVVRHRTDRPPA
jgi:hypothetical protein